MGFRMLKDEESIEEIARMSTNRPHTYGSNIPRTFSTPLRSHTESKHSSLFLKPTFKTVAALREFTNPETVERLERIRNKILGFTFISLEKIDLCLYRGVEKQCEVTLDKSGVTSYHVV